MRKITIIHPSRGRPELCYRTASLFLENSSKQEIEYFIGIDESDLKKEEYVKNKPNHIKLLIGNTNSCVESLNFVAKEINFQDILVVVSDDFSCQKDWDCKIRDSISDKKDFVLKTNDGREPWIVTFPIMDRVYYNRFGYVYNPEYVHLFCDTEMTHVSEITGRLIVDQNIYFEHLATSVTHNDETNRKNSSTWGQGESVYLRRVRNNFDLPAESIVKKASHPSHVCWLEGKGVKV
jgi:hypothetical protein